MNTREREVMDALATALRDARDSVAGELALERAAFKGYEGSSNIAQLEAELVAIDSALAAYDALLAEGSASSEGAEAVGWVGTLVGGDMSLHVQWSTNYCPTDGDRFYLQPQKKSHQPPIVTSGDPVYGPPRVMPLPGWTGPNDAPLVPSSYAKLFSFYGVTGYGELIAAQAAHIERLQEKMSTSEQRYFTKVREG